MKVLPILILLLSSTAFASMDAKEANAIANSVLSKHKKECYAQVVKDLEKSIPMAARRGYFETCALPDCNIFLVHSDLDEYFAARGFRMRLIEGRFCADWRLDD